MQSDIRRELERRFSPEFRNRIDDVTLFAPLTTDDVRRIAKSYLLQLEQTVAKAGKTIQIDEAAFELIATEGYCKAFGARFLKRVIDERIKLPITMNWNRVPTFTFGSRSSRSRSTPCQRNRPSARTLWRIWKWRSSRTP